MSRHRGGGQPAFSRLTTYIRGLRKKWYKQMIHRASRRGLHQARDIELHQDKRLEPWSLD